MKIIKNFVKKIIKNFVKFKYISYLFGYNPLYNGGLQNG